MKEDVKERNIKKEEIKEKRKINRHGIKNKKN